MKQFRKMTYPYVIWISIMIVVPMLLILLYAFTTEGNEVTNFVFTFANFKRFLSDAIFLEVLWRSLKIAVATTVICILLGYPAGYYIAKSSEKIMMRWVLVITMPTWINMLVRTYAWVGILQDGGVISRLFAMFGFDDVVLLYTDFAVVLGMVYNFLPFMIIPIHTALSKMDKSYKEAAFDLGANRVQSFWKVTFKLPETFFSELCEK